jgi:alpha-tubulin suppressor-like RCC1 family protein
LLKALGRAVQLGAVAIVLLLPAGASGDQSSQPAAPAAGQIATGKHHSCVVRSGAARCWGFGGDGRLGYSTLASIGDDETPGSVGPIDVGAGRGVQAISAGSGHTCALLDDATVRCWGFGGDGRLGYSNALSSGAQAPATAGPVDLGAGRSARMISAGEAHTCAVLDNGSVRCWGFGLDGRLGYANTDNIGDDETPGSIGPVDLGAGRTATAISAGRDFTCAVLDDASVRCWGYGGFGALGYGSIDTVGDDETPGSKGPVALGAGRSATAISAGSDHVCALLDDASVKCWGYGGNGQLGYGDTATVGLTNTPASAGTVDLGTGRTAQAITAGGEHTCALLDDAGIRCWGESGFGQLGYANKNTIGDDEVPGTVGPVDVGRSAVAVDAGDLHTCALLDDTSVRCWGYGANGRLGYCSETHVGDDETPAAAGAVDLGGGAGCARPAGPPVEAPAATGVPPAPVAAASPADPRVAEAARARRLRSCLRGAGKRPKRLRGIAKKTCLKRYRRIPGRVSLLHARAISSTRVVLTFSAPGSDGGKAPAARDYLVKQSRRPIADLRGFVRGQALCGGSCHFKVATAVGQKIALTVTDLRPRSVYYFAVAARDNVTHQRGPRAAAVVVRTR